MIANHQPKSVPTGLQVALSSVDDGSMKHDSSTPESVVRNNRKSFLARVGIKMDKTSLVRIDYSGNDFCRYKQINQASLGVSMERSHDTPAADALSTGELDRAIFLPVADCCPLVIADTDGPAFMVSHIGRHSIEQDGAAKSVRYMTQQYGLSAARLWVWLGPMVGGDTYPLTSFGGRSLEDVISQQLLSAGILTSSIESCRVDTAKDERYYSHSQYLTGKRAENGRFAVVAVRRHIQ